MYNPFVVKANDGTWRALWSVNQHAPQFAVAYSEDLITWRPQDYPIIREKGVKDVAAYQMDDGNFDIYLKTSKGKRYVQASNDFRTFKEDTLEASADEILLAARHRNHRRKTLPWLRFRGAGGTSQLHPFLVPRPL